MNSLYRDLVSPPFHKWLAQVSPDFTWNWPHLIHIRKSLRRITQGQTKRLMLFVPPRHGKSEMVTVRYPAWMLERDPSLRVIVGAYNQDLANKFSRKTRRVLTGRIGFADDRNTVNEWETTAGGGLKAVGVGAGITGHGANLIIIDDPVKSREEAESATYRDRVWDWYTDDLYTRLEPNGAIILIMTRWHTDDLAGRLRDRSGEPWEVVNLPALAEPEDAMGRAEGSALCPARYDVSDLMLKKGEMGSSSFEALYQQRPTAREGGLFKRDWWKYFRQAPPVHTAVVQSWDTAFKKGEGNDYSVCTTWLVAGNGYYLIDRWKNKIEFPDLKRTAVNLAAMHNPHVILIEDKASGQSLIQELKRDTRLPIIPVTVDRDKEARANAVTAVVESGRVFLPEASDWTQDFVDELAAFPAGAHDDQVDSFTQAMNYFREHYTGVSVDTTGVSRVSSGAAIDRFTGGGQARRAIGAYMRA